MTEELSNPSERALGSETKGGGFGRIKDVILKRFSKEREPIETSALETFKKAAEIYGAKGLEYERLEDGTEVLRQNLGEGWHGVGYDGTNLWMGLTAQGERYGWNANTILRSGEEQPGITLGKKGRLAAEHPIAQMLSILKDREGVELHIVGSHTEWSWSEETKLNPDDEGNLVGNIPEGNEVKAMITNIDAEWKDAGWKFGQEQELRIKP